MGEWFSSIISLFSTFRVTDLIDIIIIAVFIYGIFKLVRETRAEQLLKGIFFVLIFYGAAVLLGLTMVTSILKVVLEFSVVIVVIIFQPEIRKALEQLGRSKFTSNYFFRLFQGGLITNEDKNRVTKAITDVADSAILFSHTRTGALIVFERETKLTDIASTGTVLNCDTSTAIFGNLFFNKAPLHDGACIIREGKIFAGGCILPLNSKEVTNRDIGTRHRAAIGMSEVSDAVVVVVSEETGQISMAVNGVLTRDYDRDALILRLEEMLIPPDTENESKTKRRKKRRENTDEE
ncbi:MAG: diadenylate cyclase CdaA [Oscillospiraceae bacterium]|nr:diadenylate cyclase CdaA [Oscillospiraceae bacterium]